MSGKMFIYELPFSVRRSLILLLDATDKWEELGGEHMGFDWTYLQYIRKKPSPTDELLTRWGNQCHTVKELFVLFSRMQFYRAMILLKDLVDKQYHHLLREGEELMNQSSSKDLAQGDNQPGTDQRPQLPLLTSVGQGPSHRTPLQDNKNLGLNPININQEKNKEVKKIFPEIKIENAPNVRNEQQQVDHNSNVQNNLSSGQSQAANNPGRGSERRKLSNESLASSMMEGCTSQISYEELEAATNGWDTRGILGRGGFGTVYKGEWKNTPVAIKKLEHQKGQQIHTEEIKASQMSEAMRELRHLNSHRHDNILALYGYSVSDKASCLVYQYMANGSLEDRLHCRNNTKPLNWRQRLNIVTGTARGIQFLHSVREKPLVHGDIKSANILLDSNMEPRIGDFGLAREGPHQQYTHFKVSRVHGTKPYLPDEFLRARQFSVRVDTYSFGVVLFEVATGLRAYDENRKERFLKDFIVSYEGDLGNLADGRAGQDSMGYMSATRLLTVGRSCVTTRPKDRPDMKNVLKDIQALYDTYKTTESTMLYLASQHCPTHIRLGQNSPTPVLSGLPLILQIQHDERHRPSSIAPHSQEPAQLPLGSPCAVTVQPPTCEQASSAAPPQVEQACGPPTSQNKSVEMELLPLLTIIGIKDGIETNTENQSNPLQSAVSSQATSTQLTTASIAISTNNQSEVASAISTAAEQQENYRPEVATNDPEFSISLPGENNSSLLPRLTDLLGS